MNIIVLGDKYQKRMKSKGCVGLIKQNNQHTISHQYKVLKKYFPDANIVYVYGFDSKRLLSYIDKHHESYEDLVMIHNTNYDKHNYSYSLYLAQKYLNDDCMIIFGDHLIKSGTFNNFKPNLGSQAFINTKQKSKLGCIINNSQIDNISYDLDNYLCEIYFISKAHIKQLRSLVSNTTYHNCFIFELINKMIDLNHKIIPYFTNIKTSYMQLSQ